MREASEKADGNDAICCEASRFFKYLVPQYAEEFAHNIKNVVIERLRVVTEGEGANLRNQTELYRRLYGEQVLPEGIVSVLNGSIDPWVHVATSGEHIPLRSCEGSCSQLCLRTRSQS